MATLCPFTPIKLSGYGFYIVHRAEHPKMGSIKAFITWTKNRIAGLKRSDDRQRRRVPE